MLESVGFNPEKELEKARQQYLTSAKEIHATDFKAGFLAAWELLAPLRGRQETFIRALGDRLLKLDYDNKTLRAQLKLSSEG